MAQAPERLLTLEEFLARPDREDGAREEILDGRLIVTPPPGGKHGRISSRIDRRIGIFGEERALGEAFTNAGFLLETEPPRLVEPDVAFIARDRLPAPVPDGHIPLTPDLAVEVVSPSDSMTDVREKVAAYLDGGAQRVWVVVPVAREVTVYRPGARPAVLGAGDTLTSDEAGFAVEGFELPVASLFE